MCEQCNSPVENEDTCLCPDCEARAREFAEQHLEDMKAAPCKLAEWAMRDLVNYRSAGGIIWISYDASECPGPQWHQIAVVRTEPCAAYIWTPKSVEIVRRVR